MTLNHQFIVDHLDADMAIKPSPNLDNINIEITWLVKINVIIGAKRLWKIHVITYYVLRLISPLKVRFYSMENPYNKMPSTAVSPNAGLLHQSPIAPSKASRWRSG